MSAENPLRFLPASELDPKGAEPRTLLAAVNFRNARVLEVGAGDGRLTLRYARDSGAAPHSIVAMDVNQAQVFEAGQRCRGATVCPAEFICASAARLPFRERSFEIVLLASAL